MDTEAGNRLKEALCDTYGAICDMQSAIRRVEGVDSDSQLLRVVTNARDAIEPYFSVHSNAGTDDYIEWNPHNNDREVIKKCAQALDLVAPPLFEKFRAIDKTEYRSEAIAFPNADMTRAPVFRGAVSFEGGDDPEIVSGRVTAVLDTANALRQQLRALPPLFADNGMELSADFLQSVSRPRIKGA